MILEYCMIRGNNFPPVRANPSDAGLDLCWSPPSPSIKGFTIEPGESVLLGSGCRFAIPHGYMMEIKNRSSVAFRRQLIVGASVVDSGYDGEVFINLHNIGNKPQTIEPGEKIAQAVIIPVVHARFVATDRPEIYEWYPITISDRGEGALGSTGK